jgi:hypothetical protein
MRSRQSQNQSDWVAHDQPTAGVERIEAFFQGNAYAMHRHDTYVSRTLGGSISGIDRYCYSLVS